MKRLIQILALAGLLALTGCKKEHRYGPHQIEHETRAGIISTDYSPRPREIVSIDKHAPNYPLDRLYDKNCPTANQDIRAGL